MDKRKDVTVTKHSLAYPPFVEINETLPYFPEALPFFEGKSGEMRAQSFVARPEQRAASSNFCSRGSRRASPAPPPSAMRRDEILQTWQAPRAPEAHPILRRDLFAYLKFLPGSSTIGLLNRRLHPVVAGLQVSIGLSETTSHTSRSKESSTRDIADDLAPGNDPHESLSPPFLTKGRRLP